MYARLVIAVLALLLGAAACHAQYESDLLEEMNAPQEQPWVTPDDMLSSPSKATTGETAATPECSAAVQEHDTPVPSPYKSLRYDEDYTYLRDADRATDFWDPVKYIPLSENPDHFLSIGGETRQRYEFYHNPEFGRAPQNAQGNNDWMLQRYMLHSDLHLNENVRLFGQLISGVETGEIGGPRPDVDRDDFDAHQAFIDLSHQATDSTSLTWRTGRQEFEYGSGRLISAREAPNLRRSFDAARLLAHSDDWEIDSFWGPVVRNRFYVFDDDPNPNKSLWGVYAVGPAPWLPDGHTDLYYLGFENEQGTYYQGTAYELRHTMGTRLWGKPLPWEYNTELLFQFGKFGDGQIQAWAFASDTHYNYSDLPGKPRVGLRADASSGDRNPDDPDLQTYNPLFPTGAYFNLADLGGPSNFMHVHPTLDLTLSETVKLMADWGFFWRTSLDDALYSIAVFPIVPGEPSRARYNGSSPALTVIWEPTRHVTVLASYVHFFAGPFIRENPPGKDVDYATTWVTYKF